MPKKTLEQQIEKLARTTERQIEKFAQATQKEFLSINKRFNKLENEMVTKKDFEQFGVEVDLRFATKNDLQITEQRLLYAINNTEVKKRDFESLKDDVDELDSRVATLEKHR